MPDTPPPIGVEFLALRVRNPDGAYTSIFVTLTDSQQRFTVRTVNDSSSTVTFIVTSNGGVESSVPIPSGETTNWNVGNRRYNQLDQFEVRTM